LLLVCYDYDEITLADLIKHYGPISCAAQVAVTPQGH
jgi:hypothetical protein